MSTDLQSPKSILVSGRPRHACHTPAHASLVFLSAVGRGTLATPLHTPRWFSCQRQAEARLLCPCTRLAGFLVSGRPRHACHTPAQCPHLDQFLSAVGRGTLATPMHTPRRFLSGRRWHNCHAPAHASPVLVQQAVAQLPRPCTRLAGSCPVGGGTIATPMHTPRWFDPRGRLDYLGIRRGATKTI